MTGCPTWCAATHGPGARLHYASYGRLTDGPYVNVSQWEGHPTRVDIVTHGAPVNALRVEQANALAGLLTGSDLDALAAQLREAVAAVTGGAS
jgi:hypothetical protein